MEDQLMPGYWGTIVPGPAVTAGWFTIPFSIASALELPSLRRHAIVALTDGEIRDYYAESGGAWQEYSLGTY